MDGRWGRPDDWLHELENSCGRESCCGIPGLNAELGTEFGCNYGVGSNNCESDVAALNAKFGTSLRCNTNNFNVEGCNPAALELLNFYGTHNKIFHTHFHHLSISVSPSLSYVRHSFTYHQH